MARHAYVWGRIPLAFASGGACLALLGAGTSSVLDGFVLGIVKIHAFRKS